MKGGMAEVGINGDSICKILEIQADIQPRKAV